jgi:hypothetical protein
MATDDDSGLQAFLAAGREPPKVGPDLSARMLADAAALAAARAVPAPRAAARRPGLAGLVAAVFGGWPAVAGMASAAAAGVWLGFSSPDLGDGYLASSDSGYTLGDFMPDLAALAGGG